MSHFSVLVVADSPKDLERRLAPFHEYESTGELEFTEWVDCTDEVKALWKENPKLSDGKTIRQTYQNMAELADEHFGYRQNGKRFGRRTNPNAKWDWWMLGGRWTGKLALKPVTSGKEGYGESGFMQEPENDPSRADYAEVADIDWDGMRAEQLAKRTETWQTYHAAAKASMITGLIGETLGEAVVQVDSDESQTLQRYENWLARYPGLVETIPTFADYRAAVRGFAAINDPFWDLDDYREMQQPLEEFVRPQAITYAFVDETGAWNQEGEMGWFGMDDKSQGTPDYDEAFWKLIERLEQEKPHQMVYVVDCHI